MSEIDGKLRKKLGFILSLMTGGSKQHNRQEREQK
jgi:hypothetical protein